MTKTLAVGTVIEFRGDEGTVEHVNADGTVLVTFENYQDNLDPTDTRIRVIGWNVERP